MKITNVNQLHDSGSFPAHLGEEEFVHLLYDHQRDGEERVFVTGRGDGTWLLRQTFSSHNEPMPDGYSLVLDAEGKMFYLLGDGTLKEQVRFSFDRFQQLRFYVQRSFY